jgi:WD40 repeat protein
MSSIALAELDFVEYKPLEILDAKYNESLDRLLVLKSDNQVQILDCLSMQLLRSIGLNRSLSPIRVFWSIGNRIIVVTSDGLVLVYALHNPLQPIHSINTASPGIWGADYQVGVFGENGQEELLALCADDGTVAIYANNYDEDSLQSDALDFRLLTVVNNFGNSNAKCLACEIVPETKMLFACYSTGEVKKYKIGGANPVVWNTTVKAKTPFWKLRIFNNDFIVVGGKDGRVAILDSNFGAIVRTFTASLADVTSIAVDAKHHRFFFSGYDSRVFMVNYDEDARDFNLVAKTRGQTHEINALELDNKRSRLISGGKTSDLCFYKLDITGFTESEQAKKIHAIQDLGKFVFYSKNNLIGYYLHDKAAILRLPPKKDDTDSSQGIEVLFEYRNSKYLNALAFSPKHNIFVCSVYEDSAVKVYHVSSGKLLKTLDIACGGLVFQDDVLHIFNTANNSIENFKVSKNALIGQATKHESFEELGGFLDQFEISVSKNVLLLANHEKKAIIVHRLADKATVAVGSLLDRTSLQLLKFFGNTEKLLLIYSNFYVYLYNPFKDAKYKQRLEDLIPRKVGALKGVIFHPTKKDRFMVYSHFYIVIIDLEQETTSIVKKAKPILFVGQKEEGQVLMMTADWKKAIKQLGNPVNTKKFVN